MHLRLIFTLDDKEKNESLQRFMTDRHPNFAKDSLKHKCHLITTMYISLLDGLIDHCNFTSSDTFGISKKTKDYYLKIATTERERTLVDSLLVPVIDETNNTKGELYAKLRIAKGFAEMEELDKMKNSLRENQDKIKDYYYTIFNEQLK